MGDYTLIQSGDADAAENVGALAGTTPVNHIVDGLALSNYDAAAPSIDVGAGKTAHVLETATAEWTEDDGTQQSEQRDQVQIVVHLDAQTIPLDDGAVNHLYVDPNVGISDSPQLVANTTGDAPSTDTVKIGEVDTATDTVSGQWRLVAADGTLTFPDKAAATSVAGELPNGTVVYTRSEEVYWSAITGSLKRMVPWSDPDGDGVYELPTDTDGIDVSTLVAEDATIANRDIRDTLYRHAIGVAEARFEAGLSKLDYTNGWFDILEDQSLVETITDVEGFAGSVTTVAGVDNGSFVTPPQSLGFTPTSVVIGHDADQMQDGVIAENGDQVQYDIAPDTEVTDVTLNLTGVTNTGLGSVSAPGVENGDTVPYSVGGDEPAQNAEVTFTGTKSVKSRQISGSSTGTKSIPIDGNLEPTGPANGDPQVSVTMGSSSLPDVESGAGGATSEVSFTIPNDYPTDSARVEFETQDGGGYLSAYVFKNGNQIWSHSDDAYGFSDTEYNSVSVTVSPGDTFTLDAQGDPVNYFRATSIDEPRTGDVTISAGTDSTTITNGGSAPLDISESDTSVSVSKSGDAFSSYTVDYNDISQTEDPSLTIGSETVSHTGLMSDGETVTKSVSLSPGSGDASVGGTGPVDVNASWTEVTTTTDPVVELITDAGTQTISYSGTLADGETVDLSDQVDPSLIGGSVTANITVSDGVTSPVGQVGIEFNHDGFDSGGLIKYRVADVDGNAVTLEEDEIVDVAFTSSDVTVEPILQDGFAAVELYDYAAYFNDGS